MGKEGSETQEFIGGGKEGTEFPQTLSLEEILTPSVRTGTVHPLPMAGHTGLLAA